MIEKTLAIIKPDAVRAHNSGKIIDLIEKNGFTIIELKKMKLSQNDARAFYAVHKDRPFYQDLVQFMASGPIIVMALEKENAIADWRSLMGDTNPATARPGTVRKLFGASVGENATHGSDAQKTAAFELNFFFPDL